MADPYREGTPPSGLLDCPRCGKPLPPMDMATCPGECGTWVNASIQDIVFQSDEIAENRTTRWWRVREPCPVCKEQMLLRGSEDHELFQGCSKHGYWVDADTVSQTGLGRPGLVARLKKIRDDEEERIAASVKRKADEQERARKEKEEAERLRQEREREAERLREEGRKEAQRKADEKQRKADEKRRQGELKQRQREEAKREKAEANRRAHELEVQLAEQRQARLLEAVKAAMATGDPAPIVNELVTLDKLVADLTKRVSYLEKHTVKFERAKDD